jgi:serine/threonine protein kinase
MSRLIAKPRLQAIGDSMPLQAPPGLYVIACLAQARAVPSRRDISVNPNQKPNPQPRHTAGTFAYASPEAIMGSKLTLKSDIYSFGIVLLEVCWPYTLPFDILTHESTCQYPCRSTNDACPLQPFQSASYL